MDELKDAYDGAYPHSTFRRTAPPARRPPARGGRRARADEVLWLLTRILDETRSAAASEKASREEMLCILRSMNAQLAQLHALSAMQRDFQAGLLGQLNDLVRAAQVIAHGNVLPTPPPRSPRPAARANAQGAGREVPQGAHRGSTR